MWGSQALISFFFPQLIGNDILNRRKGVCTSGATMAIRYWVSLATKGFLQDSRKNSCTLMIRVLFALKSNT